MANNTPRHSACFPVFSSVAGLTVEEAIVPSSLLACRGPCHILLFLSICVYCLSSLLIFNLCSALQVDCSEWPPVGGSRSGRGSSLNNTESSVPLQAPSTLGRGRESTVDSRKPWLPTRLVNLRSIHVHRQQPEHMSEPVALVNKDSEGSFNFHSGNIAGSTNTSTTPRRNAEVGGDFTFPVHGGNWSKHMEPNLREPRNNMNESYPNSSTDVHNAAGLEKVGSKASSQAEKTGGDVDFFLDLNDLAIPRKGSSKARPQNVESEPDFNFSLDVEGGAKSKKERSKPPPWKDNTGGNPNFSVEIRDEKNLEKPPWRARPQQDKFGESFNFSLDLDKLTKPRADRSKVPYQTTENQRNSNFTLDLGEGAKVKNVEPGKPRRESETGASVNFSLDVDEGAELRYPPSKPPYPKDETEGDLNFSLDFNNGGKSTVQASKVPFQKSKTEGDSNLNQNVDKEAKTEQAASKAALGGTQRRKIPAKVPLLEDETEGDFNFSLDFNNKSKSREQASKVPLQERKTGGDIDFNLNVDERSKSKKSTSKVPLKKDKSGGDSNFFSGTDDREKSENARLKAPPWKAETVDNFSLSSDTNAAMKLKGKQSNRLSAKDATEGDFHFNLNVGEKTKPEQAASKTVNERRKRMKTSAKVPRSEGDTGEDVNFSLDLGDAGETATTSVRASPQKTETAGDFNFSLEKDKGTQRRKATTKAPRQKGARGDNSDFPLDLGSQEKSRKTPKETQQKDEETDVYTLLDEEEDYDEDDEGSSKAGLEPSAQTKPRFKLTGVSKTNRENRPSLSKRTPSSVQNSTEDRKDLQKEVFKDTVPVSLPGATLPTDAWHKLDTTASSADFVKSLEAERARQREARNALEEKRLDAPLLTNMYTRAVKTVPATNYLGVGYDAVKGNPLGDPTMMADPGLRSPIIAFAFEQSRYGVTNDLSTLQPLGAYTRPFAACRQSESVSELSTLDDYQKELAVDASMEGGDTLGLNRFSGSVGYQNFAKELSSKETKSYLLKTYCIRYEAGVAQTPTFNWNYTLAFQDAVSHLPTSFDGQNEDTPCNVLQWRQDSTVDACVDTNIPTWMDFIQQFGTHYIVRLFAGGKMTFQVALKSSDVSRLKKKGVDVKTELKVMLGGFGGQASAATQFHEKSASNVRSLDIEKETLVIGGRPPGNVSDPAAMAQWADTVEELPMPVKVELQSLGGLLPEEKRIPFERAAKYYGKAYGMSVQDLQVLELAPEELPEILRSATQVAWAGPPPGYAKCPTDTVVLFGYAMKLNFNLKHRDDLASYLLVACAAGREKCDGVGSAKEEDDDERIFVVCGKETLNDLYQIVATSPYEDQQTAVATCPEETVIVLGFGMAVATGDDGAARVEVESCQTGQTICTKNLGAGTRKSFVWAVCAEKNYPGIMNISNVVQIDARGPTSKKAKNRDGLVTVSCPKDDSILLGFAMEAHTHLPEVRQTYTTCDKGKPDCSLQGAGVDTAIFGRDHHSLLSWIVCSPKEKEVAHAVTENPEHGRKYETKG